MTTYELLSPSQRDFFNNLSEEMDIDDVIKYYTLNC